MRWIGDDHRGQYTSLTRGWHRRTEAEGLEPPSRAPLYFSPMENDMVKRLMWSGLLAGLGALSSIIAQRAAGLLWRRLFDEEPPE